MSIRTLTLAAAFTLSVILLMSNEQALASSPKDSDGTAKSADGLEIAYTERGSGDIALVFIHGGLADRSFWAPQLSSLSSHYRLVALDLGGHGKSGRERKAWTIPAFAEDVRAVVEKLGLKRVVLIGNSLGGVVALEAARLLKGRVLCVVGVDTLHDAFQKMEPAMAHARAEAFRNDFQGTCHQMVSTLFHPGKQEKLQAWAEEKMCAMPKDIVVGLMEGLGGYDLEAAFRAAGVPIRAINGDRFPTSIEKNRTVTPDFNAVVMVGAGHYPMLERPEEFNRLLVEVVKEADAKSKAPAAHK